MKILLAKKTVFYITLLFLGLLFTGLFTYYWNNVRSPYRDYTANAEGPFFPPLQFFIQNDAWRIDTIQPLVAGYKSRDGSNYLVAQYRDIGGTLRHREMFLTGKTVDKEVDEVVIIDFQGRETGEKLTLEQIKERHPIGSQVLLFFIAEHPTENEFNAFLPFLDAVDPILPVYMDSGYFDAGKFAYGTFYISAVGEELYVHQ